MMYQGVLGKFPFSVTEIEICTFRDLTRNREYSYAEHKVVSGLPKLQHTGRNLDTVELTVILFPLTPASTVKLRLAALEKLTKDGDDLPLVLGLQYMGRFVLKSQKVTHRIMHNGVTLSAEVALALQEYN